MRSITSIDELLEYDCPDLSAFAPVILCDLSLRQKLRALLVAWFTRKDRP